MISLNGARSGPAISTMPPRGGERHIGDDRSNVVRRDRLEQDGRKLDDVSIRTRIGDAAKEFHELGRADNRVGMPAASISFSWASLARK
jgi:hypothetical protein